MHEGARLIPGWKPILAATVPLLLGAGALAGAFLYTWMAAPAAGPDPGLASSAKLNVPPPAGLLVDVIGAVARPGLYRMQRGERVYDAIAAAGGLTEDADPVRLPNLAGRLRDGEQIKVPFASGAVGSTTVPRVSLNSATLEELELTPGFTPALAAEAIDYRANFGGFQNTRELVEVLGMSEADFVIARRHLTL